ncbi:hypothetical protein HDV06_007159 [Boothiomyces sp. JEL0866]|nr:hypothetical protein HDV06_007159 [Boothiomyces sp. JEL0866]
MPKVSTNIQQDESKKKNKPENFCYFCSYKGRGRLAAHYSTCKNITLNTKVFVEQCQFCDHGRALAIPSFDYLQHLHRCIPFQKKLNGYRKSDLKAAKDITRSPVYKLLPEFNPDEIPSGDFSKVQYINGKKYIIYAILADSIPSPDALSNDEFSPSTVYNSSPNDSYRYKDVTRQFNKAQTNKFVKGFEPNCFIPESLDLSQFGNK